MIKLDGQRARRGERRVRDPTFKPVVIVPVISSTGSIFFAPRTFNYGRRLNRSLFPPVYNPLPLATHPHAPWKQKEVNSISNSHSPQKHCLTLIFTTHWIISTRRYQTRKREREREYRDFTFPTAFPRLRSCQEMTRTIETPFWCWIYNLAKDN